MTPPLETQRSTPRKLTTVYMGFLEEIHHLQSQGVYQLIDFLRGWSTGNAPMLEDVRGQVHLDRFRVV